jgi:hypothetical protein
MIRIGRMHYESHATAGQAGLRDRTSDTFMVDLPARTHQGIGDTMIAIADKGFTNLMNGLTKLLVAFQMSQRPTVLVIPLLVDPATGDIACVPSMKASAPVPAL